MGFRLEVHESHKSMISICFVYSVNFSLIYTRSSKGKLCCSENKRLIKISVGSFFLRHANTH
jgi:hypothetical protein